LQDDFYLKFSAVLTTVCCHNYPLFMNQDTALGSLSENWGSFQALSLVVLHNKFKRVTAAHNWSIHYSES
jgi:hypothetical protein